jgi:SulP family sulfate permease
MNSRVPKLVQSLRVYTLQKFIADVVAGLTVGLVALPLAMAFAIASGVPPESGIYCAVIAGFLISALGGSKTQIGGPTGAFVVVVYGIVAKHGLDGLFMCTMMAGVLLVLLGITGLGTAVKFIPRPVVVGFTNGIAVLIASTQIKDFLGLEIANVPGEFLGRMRAIGTALNTVSPASLLLGLGALALILLTVRFARRVPGYIVALVLGTAAVALLHVPVETIGTRFGGLPSGLPDLVVPSFRADLIPVLIPSAITIAMLGAIESLMSAVVADRMSGDTHNPNTELVAQGIANIASPLFGGLPATGAIARTATNIRSGAQSPVAGVVHALVLLCILLFAAPLASYIPLAVLAAILLVVSANMGEWHEIPELLKLGRADVAVWLVTFALTVFADLTVAVQVGMILAALLYIRRVTGTTTVEIVTEDYVHNGRIHTLQDKHIPDDVAVIRIHGPFLFGATGKLSEAVGPVDLLPPIVILRLRNMTALDATGVGALEDLAEALHASGRRVIVCGARYQPAQLIRAATLEDVIGRENVCESITEALARARELRAATGVA